MTSEDTPTQLWLFNPDFDWPGHPSKPPGDGWVWIRDEVDIVSRFHGHPTLEIVAAKQRHYPATHEVLALYGIGQSGSCGLEIGGWLSPSCRLVLALGHRGGAWVRRVGDPTWARETAEVGDTD